MESGRMIVLNGGYIMVFGILRKGIFRCFMHGAEEILFYRDGYLFNVGGNYNLFIDSQERGTHALK